MILKNRIRRTQEAMTQRELDLLLVVGRENLIYFTGLTQIECMAILIPKEGEACAITLWLDAAYVQQETGLITHGYLFPKETVASKVVQCIQKYGYERPRIGFERYYVDFAMYDALRQALRVQFFWCRGSFL